ncbi:MAG: hypothetical protein LBT97_03200 [Planctomycetota bacterium]|jgi:hypothetical protein|nr:hypothetical protein [Planctomycetota bacterium]
MNEQVSRAEHAVRTAAGFTVGDDVYLNVRSPVDRASWRDGDCVARREIDYVHNGARRKAGVVASVVRRAVLEEGGQA